MAGLAQLPLFFMVGFVEMVLITSRTYWTAKGRSKAASLVVFFETMIAMFVFYQVIQSLGDNFLVVVAYAIGNSVGTYIYLEKSPI